MSLPIGYRVLGVLCLLFGLIATLSATLTSLVMSGNDQVRTLTNYLGMVALAFFGVFSLVAGVCLFLRSPAAWGLARKLLRFAAFCSIALFLLDVHGMVEDRKLLDEARKFDERARRLGLPPANMAKAVQRNIDDSWPIHIAFLVAIVVWVLALSDTAGRLRRRLPPAHGADPPPDPLVTEQPTGG